LTKNLLQDDAVEPVTHWFNVGRSKDRALFLQHFLPDGSDPPPGSSNSSHRKELEPDSLEARAKEFERKRYESCYTSMIGKSALRSMPHSSGMANILGDADLKVYLHELFRPDCLHRANAYDAQLLPEARDSFHRLLRSLSIATRLWRSRYSSVYTVGFQDRNAHFQPSEMSTSALSSTLSLPVVFARQEPRKVPPHEDPDPRVVEALKPKRGVKVEGQGAKLLEFAGGSGYVNSSYRDAFKYRRDKYPDVVAEKELISMGSNRVIPQTLLPAALRHDAMQKSALPCMMQTRKMLSHGPKSIAQPAWQMLYKNGITYTEGQERHDPGETGVYKKDFRKAEVFAAPSVPNIRSNDSTIQIKMSDFRYVTTEYEDKLGRSAHMDRTLV